MDAVGGAVVPAEAFLRYRFACEASPNTLRAYAHDLKLFFAFLAERSIGWREVSPAELGEFVAWLRRPAGNVILLYQQRVNIRGERISVLPDDVPEDAVLLKERISRGKQTLPNGYCGLPLQLQCPHPKACLSCDAFLTDTRFRPVLEQQLQRTRQLIGRARTAGHERVIEINTRDEASLVAILDALDKLEDDHTEAHPSRRLRGQPNQDQRRAASAAIRRLDERGDEITFVAIAREAGVDGPGSTPRPTSHSRSPSSANRAARRSSLDLVTSAHRQTAADPTGRRARNDRSSTHRTRPRARREPDAARPDRTTTRRRLGAPDLTRPRRRQRSPKRRLAAPMIGSIPGLVVAILLLAEPAVATCGHLLDPARQRHPAAGVEINCEDLPCPCWGPGEGGGVDPAETPRRRAQRIEARITAVTDGDTLRVRAFQARRKTYRVRLIGIDTPELVRPGSPVECGGLEAKSAMLRLAFADPVDTDGDGLRDEAGGSGRRVVLVTDPSQDLFDSFGRLLAYVTRSGTDFGARQVRAGWAEVYVFERRFRRFDRFQDAEDSARAAGRGVRSKCDSDFHEPLR